MNQQYWMKRIDQLLLLNTADCNKQLIKEYKKAYEKIELKLTRLYDKITKDGVPSITELYRFNRFYEIQAQISSVLRKLGVAEVNIIGSKMTELYLTTAELASSQISGSFSLINKKAARLIIDEVWCQDGKVWSDRIWEDKGKLQQELTSALMDCVIKGESRAKVTAEFASRMGVSSSNAARLVRTELNHVQTQSALDRFREAGFEEYEILATMDKRTSKICKEQDGKVYKILEYQPGITAPPFHPYCRTTIIPR